MFHCKIIGTLSKTALHDMYSAGLVTVKQFLADIRAVCVMFDAHMLRFASL